MKPCGKKTGARLLCALMLCLLSLPFMMTSAGAAPAEQEQIKVTFYTDAYWYRPGDKARLSVTLENKSQQTIENVSIRLRLHSPNSSRAGLDAVLEGKPRKSYRYTETLKRGISLKPGKSNFKFDLDSSKVRVWDGVFPLSVEALEEGSVADSFTSTLVIMSDQNPQSTVPLKLSLVFDMLEPPHRAPDGDFSDNGLADECYPGGRNPGWYTTIADEMEKYKNLRTTFSLSPLVVEEMRDMADGYVVKKGQREEKFGANSTEAKNAESILNRYKKMAQDPRFQFLQTPYASPDLEKLVAYGWSDDARGQISRGTRSLEAALGTKLGTDYFYPPGLNCDSRVIKTLGGKLGQFLILSPELLERNRDGKKLLRGLTLGSPVEIEGAKESKVIALFADGRAEELVRRLEQSGDEHFVAQAFLSELTNLYLERPSKLRTCALVWPGWWRPSHRVVQEIMKALSGAPWLQSATMGESLFTVPVIQDFVLEIPENGSPMDAYFKQVKKARGKYVSYTNLVFRDNPLLPPVLHNLDISESDVWRQWDRTESGLRFAHAITDTVDSELGKIKIPAMSSITLTSADADIPLPVANETGYRVKATLQLDSNGLTFPKGQTQKVVLEPKENMLEIPVHVTKKGRIRFFARLESDGTVLAKTEMSVLTSRFNTFAIVLVGGILGLIVAGWGIKLISRRRLGKHKKRNIKKAEQE
ncbi:MAG: hypothetical protein JJE48_02285 [Actinobacteria bacterium]|nr:hypothetical protein [Actinomycetota bacterium]